MNEFHETASCSLKGMSESYIAFEYGDNLNYKNANMLRTEYHFFFD